MITFRKAIRENANILVSLAGPSGCGKTFSALRLARGLVGEKGKIAVVDTEANRAKHYADRFDFDHLDMKPPFSPEAYRDAIDAAERDGYGAIVIDSMSHEWAGDGGCQDMHDAAHAKMGGADSTSVLAWRDPKQSHKKMISRLLQSRSHLIFCLRAEEKIKFSRNDRGKMVIEPAGWAPICEKNFMFEMTASFLMLDDKPGVGRPIKLQEQHKSCFNLNGYIDEEAGRKLAEWAAGGVMRQEDGHGASVVEQSKTDTAAPSKSMDAPASTYGQFCKRLMSATSVQGIMEVMNDAMEADLTLDEKRHLTAAKNEAMKLLKK